ncbi:MAG: hypothetical protein K0Q43_163 [Ramlibacter sp.]|jgi:hypothetical protein|nr:hypothetical protein [Ramlibacter sp.]
MEIISIGRRLLCPAIQPGVEGTIVRADRRRHLTGETATYDVVWDNGQCTRALSTSELNRPEWIALPETRSVEACNELWYQTLMALTRARASQAASDQPAQRERPAENPPPARAPIDKRQTPDESVDTVRPVDVRTPRAITQHARELLSKRGFDRVAVHTSQRVAGSVLQVAWMDGTTEGTMFAVLSCLKRSGAIARIDLARSASPLMLQAAIAYVHERFYGAREQENPEPVLARVLLQVTPEAYQHNGLTGVRPPMGHPHSSQSYQQLIRCLFERWDDHHARFCDTAASRYMLSEKAALFPHGDQEASLRMAEIRSRVLLTHQQADDILSAAAEEPGMRA